MDSHNIYIKKPTLYLMFGYGSQPKVHGVAISHGRIIPWERVDWQNTFVENTPSSAEYK